MAHWLSDVLWAGPITLVCSWAIWLALSRLYKQEQAPSAVDTHSP